MNNEYSISNELREIGSILADIPRNMPYSVPSGYFENFATDTKNTIAYLDRPDDIPEWNKTLPFAVPANYFDELTGKIVAVAVAEDAMSTLPKNVPFKTPAGYFEALPAQLLKAAKAADNVHKETKLIPLLKRSISFKTIRLAAAAILLICIGFGSYKVLFYQQSANSDKILASVPNEEIHDYLQHTYRLDIDRIVGNNDINKLDIDTKDIVQYLNETGWDVVE